MNIQSQAMIVRLLLANCVEHGEMLFASDENRLRVAEKFVAKDNLALVSEHSPSSFQNPSMLIGIDPLVDFAAKRLLGSPEHERITLHFLNSVLRFKSPIVDVTITNPINLKHFEADKESILDIKAIDRIGRRYNIEVQTTRPLALPKRLTYYTAKQLVDQLREGDQYSELNPSICICLLDAIAFPNEPALRHDFQLRATDGLLLTDCLQVHLFELPKYVPPSNNEPITNPVEQWLYFFGHAEQSTPEELVRRLPDPVFTEATGVLEMIAKNPEERKLYEDRLKAERDSWAKTAQAVEDAVEVATEKALAKGELTGLAKLVAVLQGLAGDHAQSIEDLKMLGSDQLALMEAELQRRLRERG